MRSIRALALLWLAVLACKREPVAVEQPEPQMQTIVAPEFEGPKPPSCDGNAAIIGRETIPIEDFDAIHSEMRRNFEKKHGEAMSEDMEAMVRRSILDRLITYKLLELECRRLGVEYDAATLAEKEAEQRERPGDGPILMSRLVESEDLIRQVLIAHLRQRALLEHEGKLEVSAEQVAAEYERLRKGTFDSEVRIRAAEIVIDVDDPAKEAFLLAFAEDLAKRANAGEDFAQLARQYSDGASAKEGGELGIIPARAMNREVAKVAFQLEPGKISKPVRSTVVTSVSFHVIFVLERYPPGELPLAALEGEIVERFEKRQFQIGSAELAKRLYESYGIENCIAKLETSRGLE